MKIVAFELSLKSTLIFSTARLLFGKLIYSTQLKNIVNTNS